MTAIQHSLSTTTDNSLAEATRALEAAERGDLAVIPGRTGASAIRVSDSGLPWLLDPMGHNEGPAYVTTAYLAVMGYRAWGINIGTETPEPMLDFEEHCAALQADGWTTGSVARATGLDRGQVSKAFRGKGASASTKEKLWELVPGKAHPELGKTTADLIEDLEFLLEAGVEPQPAVRRAGFASVDSARTVVKRAGRRDLTDRLNTLNFFEETA